MEREGRREGRRAVLRAAVFSRVLLLSLAATWQLLLRPYDTSAAVNPPCLAAPAAAPPPRWPRAAAFLERAAVWDSVYFLRIAQCGYEYEQAFAFFPAFPLAVSLLARSALAPLQPLIGDRAVLALSGLALSNLAFLSAALSLHRLSLLALADDAAALRSAVFFCFNPASVFYSAIYSESLYAACSMGGVEKLMNGSDFAGVVMLAMSGLARSNGAVNAGFVCFRALLRAWDSVGLKKKKKVVARELAVGAAQAAVVLAPMVGFQAYGYASMCFGRPAEQRRPWCQSWLPRLYGYVQSHYWDVGFLRYFQVKQLPNFLLASPMLLLAVCSIIEYAKLRPDAVFSAGLQAPSKERRVAAGLSPHSPAHGFSSILVLPFVYQLAFMAATSFFFMHVQVATRFLSASPLIYWFAARHFQSRLLVAYFAAFFLLGSLLFPIFYPFT
ncbi:transferases, transferring hexosyl groups [Wolffia australiana]